MIFLCFVVFRFSIYCMHVLCYSHCIVTSRVCRDVFCTHNNNNNNNNNTGDIHKATVVGLFMTRIDNESDSVASWLSAHVYYTLPPSKPPTS